MPPKKSVKGKKSAKKKAKKKAAPPPKAKKVAKRSKPKKAAKPQKPAAKVALRAAAVAVEDLTFLGNDRAEEIVLGCANTVGANLFRTLSQLGVNGISFQNCVFGAVKDAGFIIGIDSIPNAPTSKLVDVSDVIQNARKA